MELLNTPLMEIFDSSSHKLMKIDVLKIGIELFKLIENKLAVLGRWFDISKLPDYTIFFMS